MNRLILIASFALFVTCTVFSDEGDQRRYHIEERTQENLEDTINDQDIILSTQDGITNTITLVDGLTDHGFSASEIANILDAIYSQQQQGDGSFAHLVLVIND